MTKQVGDTIIEVLLAMTIFGMLAVGTVMIMNQGNNASQRALEQTLVKQQIDSQAQALRAIQQDYFAYPPTATEPPDLWQKIINKPAAKASGGNATKCADTFSDVFVLNPRDLAAGSAISSSIGSMDSADATVPVYAQLVFDTVNKKVLNKSYGIWIEKSAPITVSNTKAYDFTIKACWYTPGLNTPVTLQSVVRLYESATVAPQIISDSTPGGFINPIVTPPPPVPVEVGDLSYTCGAAQNIPVGYNLFIQPASFDCGNGVIKKSDRLLTGTFYPCAAHRLTMQRSDRHDFQPGTYKMTFTYSNSNGRGSPCVRYPKGSLNSEYRYISQLYLGSDKYDREKYLESSDFNTLPYTYTFSLSATKPSISLDWINDCYISRNNRPRPVRDSIRGQATLCTTGGFNMGRRDADPNLLYQTVTLERTGP